MWNFEIIEDWDEGLRMCADFYDSSAATHVFAHPALLGAWIDTYMPLRRLTPCFIVGMNESGNRMILPLTLWRRNWKNAFLHSLVPIGHSDFDYHDPLFLRNLKADDKRGFWIELIKFISSEIPYEIAVLEGMTDRIATDGKYWNRDEICPSLELKDIDSEESLFAFFKTSLRGDIRRQMRRLNELGELHIAEYTKWEDIPAETFAAFMHHHSLRWPKAYKAPRFHENLLRQGLKHGPVHFSVMMAGELELAWHLGFEDKGRYYYYMPAGNREFSRFSPVKVHLFMLVRRAVEKGYEVYDHLRGEENYKDGWSNSHQYVNTLSISKDSFMMNMKRKILNLRGIILPPPVH